MIRRWYNNIRYFPLQVLVAYEIYRFYRNSPDWQAPFTSGEDDDTR